jgi:hypothetical protein
VCTPRSRFRTVHPGGEFGAAFGESGLRRFERDALAQSGVSIVIVRIGVNDIAFPGAFTATDESVTAADLIDAFRKLAAAAHRRGVKIVTTTRLGPAIARVLQTVLRGAFSVRLALEIGPDRLRGRNDAGTLCPAFVVMLRELACGFGRCSSRM